MYQPPIPYDYDGYNSTPVEPLKTNTYNVVPLTSRLTASASQRHTSLILLRLVVYMYASPNVKVSELQRKGIRNTKVVVIDVVNDGEAS
jgi:hypothetical protein